MAKVDLKAKAKRQKIIAAVLGVILLGVLAYELPSVLKTKKPPQSSTPAAAAPAAPAPGAPVSAPATPTGAGLVDSDPAAQAAGGQLVSFDRFASKDPFAQQLSQAGKPAAAPVAKQPPPPPKVVTPQPPSPKAAAPTSAKISVNGSVEAVGVGQEFPQADPVFRLVSLTRKTAKVAIAGGSLASGSATVTLTKGKKVTLMNTADGTRYVLVLVSVP